MILSESVYRLLFAACVLTLDDDTELQVVVRASITSVVRHDPTGDIRAPSASTLLVNVLENDYRVGDQVNSDPDFVGDVCDMVLDSHREQLWMCTEDGNLLALDYRPSMKTVHGPVVNTEDVHWPFYTAVGNQSCTRLGGFKLCVLPSTAPFARLADRQFVHMTYDTYHRMLLVCVCMFVSTQHVVRLATERMRVCGRYVVTTKERTIHFCCWADLLDKLATQVEYTDLLVRRAFGQLCCASW